MMSNVMRILESQVEQTNQGEFDLIATVGAGEADDVVSGREVKPDKRLPPFVSIESLGSDMTPKVLLIETESPDDPSTIQRLKDDLGVYQPRMP
ncbi:hypothetical protein ACGTNG_12790 [Halomonas sp. 1390]|uniref:hypothetical protein n=1 Tax=Halomonas sp. B23F22_3 TaxID=3459516 RepID=UPI00373EC2F8